jgi:membrane-associated phospholipid phosphatase
VDLRVDLLVEQALRKKPGPIALRALRAVTELGGAPFVTAATVSWSGMLVVRGHWRGGARVAATVGLGSLARYLLHRMVARPRPSRPHIHTTGAAFPSGHTTAAALLFGSAAAESGRRWAWLGAAVAVGAVGASRVILRAHWLTDVLAGVGFAGAWMALVRGVLDGASAARVRAA